jgi:hypothetical protein
VGPSIDGAYGPLVHPGALHWVLTLAAPFGEAEEVARAVGVPTRFVGFNEAAHRRFSEGWDPE